MANSSISVLFTVDGVDFSKSFDTYLNIQKRRESVFFSPASDAVNVNLSYIESQDLSSDENLTITDRSSSLVQNRAIAEQEDQILEEVAGFTIETDLFLVTDIFTTDLNTQEAIPLFYQHQLQATLAVGEVYADIRILDQSFDDVLSSNYVVSTSSGIIYSNFQNDLDLETGLSDLFFVTYVVRKVDNTLERYTEILNNAPVYREATIDDIDSGTGFVTAGTKAYLIEEDVGNTFNVILPINGDYGLRRDSGARIEVLPPPDSTAANPWFVRVRNGRFLSTGVTGINKYYIAEFAAQTFTPYFPFKQTDETSVRVSSRIIKTLQDKIALSADDDLFPSVIVYDKDNNPKFAFTSDPDKLGTEVLDLDINYSNALLGNSKVAGHAIDDENHPITGSSIDLNNGFIVIPTGFEILETDIIRSIYYYEEPDYQFTLINFNPLEDEEILDHRLVLFIRPQPLGFTYTKTLYYLLVNEDGLVEDHNIDFTLSGANTSDGMLWYDRDPSEVSWALPGALDFVENCTVEGSNNQDDILILGDIYVREAIKPSALTLNDIRIRGGGVPEAEIAESVLQNTEVEWYWDLGIWDGKPFPGAASLFVEVPASILEITGGTLTPDNVTEIVKRHTALGTYPVIHAYDLYTPTITGVERNIDDTLTLYWTPPLDNQVFDLYVEKAGNLELIFDSLTDNFITVSSLRDTYVVLGRLNTSDLDIIDGPIYDVRVIESEVDK